MSDDLIDRAAALAILAPAANSRDGLWSRRREKIAAAIRAIPSATQAGGWMPIDSAPRDRPILLYGITAPEERMVRYKSKVVFSGYWSSIDDMWCAHGSHWDGPFFDVTHWKPLDDPPTAFAPLPSAPEGEG